MTVPYLTIVVLSVCAVVFYRAGKYERSWGWLWAALSIGGSAPALGLRWGFVGVFAMQEPSFSSGPAAIAFGGIREGSGA